MSDATGTMTAQPNQRQTSFWLSELPFSLVLLLTVFGVAYTTVSRQPIEGYWELLVPFIVLVCIGAGWHDAGDSASRWRLVIIQALHWAAFLIVINMMLLPTVQRNFSANATGLAIFTLLSLGTFTAGVHLLSWQVCLLGLIMAVGIPTIAWVENSALFVFLITAGILGLLVVFWWHFRQRRRRADFTQ